MAKVSKKDERILELEEHLEGTVKSRDAWRKSYEGEKLAAKVAGTAAAVISGVAVSLLLLYCVFGYFSAKIVDVRWGRHLLMVEYKGVRYDTVPRQEILDEDRHSIHNLELRDFDLEYLVNQKKFHKERVSDASIIVDRHTYCIERVDKRIAAYRKSLGMDDPEKAEEK